MKSQILPDVFVFDVFITMSGDVFMCFYVPEESVVDTPNITISGHVFITFVPEESVVVTPRSSIKRCS